MFSAIKSNNKIAKQLSIYTFTRPFTVNGSTEYLNLLHIKFLKKTSRCHTSVNTHGVSVRQ